MAYKGSMRKTKPHITEEWFPVKDIPRIDPIYSTDTFKLTKPEIIKKGKIFQYEVFIHPVEKHMNEGGNRYFFFFKNQEGDYYSYPRHAHILNSNKEKMKVLDWFENTKVFRMFDDNGGKTGSTEFMILCSQKNLSLVVLGDAVDSNEME